MNDEYKVLYLPAALDDMRAIYSYIAFSLKAPDTAEKMIKRILENVRSLSSMPNRYVLVDWEPWRSMGIHKLPVEKYIVYYSADENSMTVKVIRVFYGGRNVESIINFKES